MSGPIEVLIKTKWYRANAAISEHYLGISLDEEQPDGLWQVRDFFCQINGQKLIWREIWNRFFSRMRIS